MYQAFKRWLSQVTTGHGAMIIAPTLLSVATGSLSWKSSVPLLLAGVAGLLWPETALFRVDIARSDLDALLAACRGAVKPGSVAASSAQPAPLAPQTVTPAVSSVAPAATPSGAATIAASPTSAQ